MVIKRGIEISLSVNAHVVQGSSGSGSYPSRHRARSGGGGHPGRDASPSQSRLSQSHTLGSLKTQIHITACFWTAEGNPCKHTDNMQALQTYYAPDFTNEVLGNSTTDF